MLILFDIDGTLLVSKGAGVRAMIEAGRRLVGDHFVFDGVEFAGCLDPLIFAAAATACGVEDPDGLHDEFRRTYTVELEASFKSRPSARALPGVSALLDALDGIEGATLGLLTGNYPETGRLKLACAGIEADRFPVAAWGADGRHRRDLPPVAMERFRAHAGRAIAPEHVIVIGDTPHDIDCARANGCRVLAVATGGSDAAELSEHEPDLLVDDLSDTGTLVAWMTTACAAR